ncbi:hypothetical protein [Clostridium perfringens]|uniref:hypothetical protein n=1 Tax=Clostridium perfringens TaxID=1502 RepID=UPI00123FD949|nr:hypothetical protein [Clostridium perfringens]
MNNEIIKKINKEIMDTKVNIAYKDFESIVRELQDKDKEIRELKKENISLKFKNIGEKNSGKINVDWIKAGSKACSEALKFEESIDKAREFLETDIEKCDNGYITDYLNFQELIDKERLKDLESKKVEDRTMENCIEECLIRLRLGQDKFKGELFEIDLTRYFCLLYGCRESQNYLTDSIMDEGYEEVLLNIEPVGIIGYGLKHKVTLKVRIPE